MRERVAGVVRVGRSVAQLAAETQVTFSAAAVAYYASFSLVPLALLGVAAATALGGEALSSRLLDVTAGTLTPAGRELVLGALVNPAGRSGATAVGAVALGWGALKGFRGLDRAFSEVYGSTDDSFFGGVVDAVVVLVLLGAAVGAILAAGAAATLLSVPAVGELGVVALVVALVVVFLPLYRFFPDADVRLGEALPGAVFAAVGWTALGVGFRLYAEHAAGYALYGLLGGLLLLLTWLYAGALVLVLGAAVNAVSSGHDAGNRQVQHAGAPGSTPMTDRPDESGAPGEEPPDDEEVAALRADVEAYRADVEAYRADIEERTVHREVVESDLRQYVRSRLRRGHARGWGPYLVLLYGTAMTLGAFYLLSGGWAILAMVVVWLSTLGLYVVMVITGAALGVLSVPGRATEALRSLRSRR